MFIRLLAVSATAFTPTPLKPRQTQLAVTLDLNDQPGVTAPFGFWDPLGLLSDAGDEQYYWYRAAELKHGRVAMMATAGWLLQESGVVFGGTIDKAGDTFASLGKTPIEQWANMPSAGKAQILVAIFFLEFHSEFGGDIKTHYTKGGPLPGNAYSSENMPGESSTYSNWTGQVRDPKETLRAQNAELNNGRLAMIGIMSFSAASMVPGSVPFL